MIFKTKFFDSSETFESWQRESQRNISRIQAIPKSIGMVQNTNDNQAVANAEMVVNILVVYWEAE